MLPFFRIDYENEMGNLFRRIIVIAVLFIAGGGCSPRISDLSSAPESRTVSPEDMHTVYEEVKTPYKYGVVVRGDSGAAVDSPSVFRMRGRWYMLYIVFRGAGYETMLAESDNLLEWRTLGKILARGSGGWDSMQAAGYIALQDTRWGGSNGLERYRGRYWLSYLGGALRGYETDPLAVGMAWTDTPALAHAWNRIPENPVLQREQPDVRRWERVTLYKSNVIHDPRRSLGAPFVMFYNGKAMEKGTAVERIGMALSDDLVHWRRYGTDPAVDNGSGISGDPQVVRIGTVWVMFYFGAFWRPGAFDTFACSYDLVHWTRWTGPDLIAPSESWDATYAHKPWMIKYEGIVYHFYCAVGDQGRVIALATSKEMKSQNCPVKI
jgi:predicted GH43/DUF377 family glycosyl hydrolase